MFVVGTKSIFALLYIYLTPEYAGRLSSPGALGYTLADIACDYVLSFILFILSGHIGLFFARGLDNVEPNQALVPTPASVTPAADAPVAPDAGAAHL